MTTEAPGSPVFVKRRSVRPDLGPAGGGAVTWQNVKIVDAAGGGDFTTIQGAIDAITDASATNRYVVLVNGGDYTEATITLKEFVSLSGRGIETTSLRVTNASGGAIVEADKIQLRYSIDTLTLGPVNDFLYYYGHHVISSSECRILTLDYVEGKLYAIDCMHTGADGYCLKLYTYEELFGTHMPLALRQALLYEVHDL